MSRSTNRRDRFAEALFALRIGVFIVMLLWTLDKFINPGHSGNVFSNFYGLDIGNSLLYAVGAIQLVIVLGFVAGAYKRYTYGLVLLMHTVSTLASWQQYLAPWDNLLFFAAWPMLAACFALYRLRDYDQLLAWDSR
jgi:hypothetical protein